MKYLVNATLLGDAEVALDAVLDGALDQSVEAHDGRVLSLIVECKRLAIKTFLNAHPRATRARLFKQRLRHWSRRHGLYQIRTDGEWNYYCLICDNSLHTTARGGATADQLHRIDRHVVECGCRWLIDRHEIERDDIEREQRARDYGTRVVAAVVGPARDHLGRFRSRHEPVFDRATWPSKASAA